MTSSSQRLRWLVICGFTALLPATGLAHPGAHAVHDAMAGFAHPFTGLDHLLAMIAVGLWAARLGRVPAIVLPVAFPLMMIVGGLLAAARIALPAIEPMIALSVITFGTLIAVGVRLPLLASLALVGVFAIFHGYAHVAESAGSVLGGYVAGFVAATVILHAAGLFIGWMTRQHSVRFARWVGAAIATTGTALLFLV